MKLYKFIFLFFIGVIWLFVYPVKPSAVYRSNAVLLNGPESASVLHDKNRKLLPSSPSHAEVSSAWTADQKEKEINKALDQLSQGHIGYSEYQKAQKELQEFNRPLMGIVGQGSDAISYQGYQKKILGSLY